MNREEYLAYLNGYYREFPEALIADAVRFALNPADLAPEAPKQLEAKPKLLDIVAKFKRLN